MIQPLLQDKRIRLLQVLKTFDRLAVALSGGVDSALLLAEARDVLANRVVAVTARSAIHPQHDVDDAARIAAELGVSHWMVDSTEMDRGDFLANTPERCYICKKVVFSQLLNLIREHGFLHLAHGANRDDQGDYRPGMKAARELGVVAPLIDAGFAKDDIRQLARARGLFVWDKPAMACLATRFPYGTGITPARVEQVRQAEALLASVGLAACRVRYHGDVARIEVPVNALSQVVVDPLRGRIVRCLRKIGFLHVAIDLEGYVAGSMNRSLDTDVVFRSHDRSSR